MTYYIILIIMTFLGSVASFYLKKSSSSAGLKQIIFDKNLYIGGIIYFISALINVYLLKYLEYSVVLPLTSITYVWTMLISHFKLNEKITRKKIIGVCIIMIGAILVAI